MLDALYSRYITTPAAYALFILGGWMANIVALLMLIWAVSAGWR